MAGSALVGLGSGMVEARTKESGCVEVAGFTWRIGDHMVA
jgi:hypothetical protein